MDIKILNTIKNKHKITDFTNHKNVIQTLKNKLSDYTTRTYIYAIIANIEDNELKEQYKKYIPQLSLSYNKKVLNNELTDNQMNSYISYDNLINIFIKTFDSKPTTNNLIISLYTLFPPRRLDYSDMIILNKKPQEYDDKLNYYINTTNGYFVFNNYKTSKYFKRQYFEVPEDLDIIIKQYIHYKKLKDNQKLIPIKGRSHFTETINKAIHTIEPDKKVSVQILRHSFLSYYHAGTTQPTLQYTPIFLRRKRKMQTHIQYSKMMAHSLEQQLSYVKEI
jgi:hypothetical protein